MTKVRLAEVCEITMGQAPRGETYNDHGDGIPLIAGAGDFPDGILRPKKFTTGPTRLSQAGDVILGIRATIGTKAWADGTYCLGRGVAGLRPMRVLDRDYLWHWLSSARADLEREARGATFLQVNRADIGNLELSLPPIEEQLRIAAVLNQTDELRAKRQVSLALFDSLNESIFLDMFGDPAADAHSPLVPLADVCDIQVGYPFKSELYTPDQDGVRLCRGANVLPGRLDWSDLRRYPTELASEFDAYRLSVGDVIIAMDRPWIKEGFKVALTTEYDAGSLLVQRVARLRANEAVSSTYLYVLLQRPSFVSHCRPTETTIPHISPREIRDYSFAAPNPKLLRRFDEAVSHTAPLVSIAGAAAAETEVLFDSLQQRAFAGQL